MLSRPWNSAGQQFVQLSTVSAQAWLVPAATATNTPSGTRFELPEPLDRLQAVVGSPALDGAAGSKSASLVAARRNCGEPSLRDVGLPGLVVAPAFDATVAAQSTRMAGAGRYGTELTVRRAQLGAPGPAPAFDGALDPQPAGVLCAGRHRREQPVGRVGMADAAGERPCPPACDGTVGPQPAEVPQADGYGAELSIRRLRPDGCEALIAPAFDSGVESHPAGDLVADRYRCEPATRRVGLTRVVDAPALDCVAAAECARVTAAGGDRGEVPAWRDQRLGVLAAPALDVAVCSQCAVVPGARPTPRRTRLRERQAARAGRRPSSRWCRRR